MISILLISFMSFADLDSGSQQALDKTKSLLNNTESRQKAAQQSPEAQKAYDQANKLMGSSQGTDALFGLSSEVFDHIVRTTNGDSKKMNQLLQKAASDPEAFAKSLPPHLQEKIKSVSKKVPKSLPSN